MTARGDRTARPARRGLFVVLEGLDGAGTTTQLGRIAAALRDEGQAVTTTSEPSQGPIGALIRQALKGRAVQPGGAPFAHDTLALLFAADRLDHLHSEIRPALARGTHVLCDRYTLSSLAYQGSALSMEWVAAINSGAAAPDLTLFLDVDLETATHRRAVRGHAEELYEAAEHQRRIVTQYKKAMALRKKHERIVALDGCRTPEEITREAMDILRDELERAPKALAGWA